MTHQEILEAMGPETTDAEARAMAEILKERHIEDLRDIRDMDFFALIPEAIERALEAE